MAKKTGLFPSIPIRSTRDTTLNFEKLSQNKFFKGKAVEGPLHEPLLVKEAGVGAWTNPEGFSAKLEETTTTQVRTEASKAVARLKGTAKAKEAIPAGTTLFTLPVGFRPSAGVSSSLTDRTAGTVIFMEVTTAGVVKTEEITIAHVIAFDGITFNLT